MKKKIYLLAALSITGILLICLTLYASHLTVKNGFVRLFPPHVLGERKILDLKYNTYFIAGIIRDSLVLGNYQAPLHVLRTDLSLSDTTSFLFTLPDSLQSKLAQPSFQVENEHMFISDGLNSLLVSPSQDRTAFEIKRFKAVEMFTALRFINNDQAVIRTFDQSLAQQVLIKMNVHAGRPVSRFNLDKLQDGLFSTDGILNYNKELSLFVYVHYYRNSFVLLDTGLRVISRSHTLDTVRKGKINLTYLKKENEIAFQDPPLVVNELSCISGNWLYVQSGLMADNESKNNFDQTSVIDAYSLPDGTYRYSFHVADYEGSAVSTFLIRDDLFIAVQGKHLLTYAFDPSSLKVIRELNP